MNPTPLHLLIASVFNLAGPDLIIILMILVLLGVPAAGVIVLLIYLNSRKSAATPPPLPTTASAAERLQQLEKLREQKLVSDVEYEEQRRRIVSGI